MNLHYLLHTRPEISAKCLKHHKVGHGAFFSSRPCMHWLCTASVPFQTIYFCSKLLYSGSFQMFFHVSGKLFRLMTLGLFGRMALDGIRMPDGCYADGTWELKMHVTDLHRDVSLRVTGEIHIGGVMLKLVEKLGMHSGPWKAEVIAVNRGFSKELIWSAA